MAEGTGGSQENNSQYKQNSWSAGDVCIVDRPNQEKNQHEQNPSRHNDRWVVHPSKKRPGLVYYFNIDTGQSQWHNPKSPEPHNHAAIEYPKAPLGRYEPTEPPDDPAAPAPASLHDSSSSTPKIYNKQIINNQFPFGSAPCKCSHLNSNSNINFSVPPPPFYPWVPPPVMIGPTVSHLNQAQTVFGPLQNFPHQYPNFKHLNGTTPAKPLKSRLGFKTSSNYTPKNHQNYLKKHFNKPNDLRNILSGRNRQDLKNETAEYPTSTQPKDIPPSIAEDEINPDDTDEWLEAHTDDEGRKLTVDMECIWKLADSTMSRDSWYIVPTAIVLINHIRFLTCLVTSEERARLLAPLSVVRALRSATFSKSARVADCAKRAMILIRQSSKHPDTPKDQPNVEACLELIEQNKLVVLLFDEKDKHRREIINDVPKFTVNELKQFLTLNLKVNTVARVQKIENITIVVPNNEAELHYEVARDNRTPSPRNSEPAETSNLSLNTPEIKDTAIKRNITITPGKRTVNASVQTDFEFTLLLPTEKDPEEQKIDHKGDTGKTGNDVVTKAEPRKIRLKRQIHPSTISDSHETKTFKWRKRKDTSSTPSSTPSQLESSHKFGSFPSTPTGDLLTQQNDNAMDFGLCDVVVEAKIVDETSTSGVISNSLDSDSLFHIKKQSVLNESKDLSIDSTYQAQQIEYEITGDFMKENLRSRCDEWVSRFVQIMEEVLTQVLHMEPPYEDSTLPPPWNVQEATACIKRKLKSHTIIVDACDKFDSFSFTISNDRGNIKTDIRPEDFMQMYSYGVHLIHVLQMVLNHEDLQTASNDLSQLLSDIREPNLDLSNEFMESFPDDHGSPNISEITTNMSTTDAGDINTVPTINESPPYEEERSPCIHSPSICSLRPRSEQMEQKEKERTDVICNENNDAGYSLFASLGLKKKYSKVDVSIVKTISNVPQDQPRWTPPTVQTEVEENKKGNVAEPTIIRCFSRCPEIENKLKNMNSTSAKVVNEPPGDYQSEDYATAEDIDFTKDETIEYEPEETRDVLNLPVYITTYSIKRCIMKSRKFCEDTYENLKSIDYWKPQYKKNVLERNTKVCVLLETVCDRLKWYVNILNRDPSVTNNKFRMVMKELGNLKINDISDMQVAEYRMMIKKYLQELKYLQTFVMLLTAAVNKK